MNHISFSSIVVGQVGKFDAEFSYVSLCEYQTIQQIGIRNSLAIGSLEMQIEGMLTLSKF